MELKIDRVLEKISHYSLDDQEIISDILQKRVIEKRRHEIYKNYRRAMQDYKKGRSKSGTVDDLFKSIFK